MKRITKITPDQAARFGEWADQWIKIGLSTEPADFDRATEAALRAYALCNLDRPKIILRMSSPYGATVGGATAWAILREMPTDKESQVESQVWSQVLSQVGSQVWSQVLSHVGSQVESQVRSQVESQVWSQVEQVLSQVGSQVRSQVGSQVGSQVWSGASNDRGGAFWASWGAYISYLRDVIGWSGDTLNRFEIDEALIRSCGWVWWHEDVLAISDRPSEIHRDECGRLHNPTGPSIAYRDGWALWSWRGVSVPEHVIMAPSAITPKTIDAEPNVEIRRVMIERIGSEKYIRDGGAKKFHQDQYGTLWKRGDEWAAVEVVNGSKEPDGTHKRYFLQVPPTCREAAEAVAWTYGLTKQEYAGIQVRT